jgi:UDP-N-acetylenolpyruvoylglucosamine reductase
LIKLSPEPLTQAQIADCDRAQDLSFLFRDLSLLLPAGTLLRRDESLARRTTLRVGGPADIYVEPPSESALATVLELCHLRGIPFFILGRGSNLLIRDGGIRGVVISLQAPAFSAVQVLPENRLQAGAGVPLKTIANTARQAGLTGLEFLEGIPGNLGGALRMNAGAMGHWTFDVVHSFRCLDRTGNIHELPAAAAGAQYRGCPMLRSHVALSAIFQGTPADRTTIDERMSAGNTKRWSSQPRQPSAGCTFKNPAPDMPAGKLIDELGLKGTRVGEAMVSDVHANFFVNLGGATATDVLRLIDLIKARVREARGVELETEVEIVGEEP